MQRTRVKICGITSLSDALAAEAAGCDAVGFVLWDGSPRCVSIDIVASITRKLSPMTTTIGVFVSPNAEDVLRVCQHGGLSGAQLCGDLGDDEWTRVADEVHLIRSIGIMPECAPRLDEIPGVSDILVDSRSEHSPGGTGQTFDWSLVCNLTGETRIWLAGGLHAGNVGEAVRRVRPFAVDVSSGVEERPGVKSHTKIAEFIAAVLAADHQTD